MGMAAQVQSGDMSPALQRAPADAGLGKYVLRRLQAELWTAACLCEYARRQAA